MDLAGLIGGHEVRTVGELGWHGVKNGALMIRMRNEFDALVTMDRNPPPQQNLAVQSFGVVLIEARSNRMIHLRPLVPGILAALDGIQPGELRLVGA